MGNCLKLLMVLITTAYMGTLHAQERRGNKFDIPYGENESVGKYAEINGIKMYYEEYGQGDPLLLIHGCGGSIKSMENQIDYFKDKFRVVIADSRGQGKSELKTDSLTYNLMTRDWEGLINHLKLDSVALLGWSDGGIIGLKMGIHKNVKIKKIVAMGANLRPDTSAINSWAPNELRNDLKKVTKMIQKDDTSENWVLRKQLIELLLYQPNIDPKDLKRIDVPVLIFAGDRDIIKNEHSVEIFNNLKKGQLCILPGANHWIPSNKSDLFNDFSNRFFLHSFDYSSDIKWQ